MAIPRITLSNVSFRHQNKTIFNGINISFEKNKYGIIGHNGVGKSTLLDLISGKTIPNSGSIQILGKIYYMPQSIMEFSVQDKVSDIIGVSNILLAMERIQNGTFSQNDFETIANDWDIEHKIQKAFAYFGLNQIDLGAPFLSFSGGQKTKILLANTMIFQYDFILLDEPTNNLDKTSREILYDFIKESKMGVIIVSHDRTLLNQFQHIVEITPKGIDCYGGNYDFYQTQKQIKLSALEKDINCAIEALSKSKKLIQTRMERHQQNEAKGKKEKFDQIKAKGQYDKITLKSQKGRSEQTNRRIRLQAHRKLEFTDLKLKEAKSKLEIEHDFNAQLNPVCLPNNKIVLNIEKLYFRYHPANDFLIKNFNLKIIGAKRIAIVGENGCGKSTIVNLILNKLDPSHGTIFIGVKNIAFLDQDVSFLNENLTLIDNFLKLNPNTTRYDAYHALAAFKFRNAEAEKKVSALSGGEKIRAGLALSILSKEPSQLLILDEPTNHLDLLSIQAIEEILRAYKGAVLAISHDEIFLSNICIDEKIELPKKTRTIHSRVL